MTDSLRSIQVLKDSATELGLSISLRWSYAPKAPKNPVTARIDPNWPSWSSRYPSAWEDGADIKLRENTDNWLYCEFTFPKRRCGINLAGDEALIFIHGWSPFTLWLDGRELFTEDHVWKASGPIGDPIIATIEPGRTYRLVACLRPTVISSCINPCLFQVSPRRCLAQAIELSAAQSQLIIADELAATDQEHGLVAKADHTIDLDAVKKRRWSIVNEQIAAMEQQLEPLSQRAKEHTVHLAGHTHIDLDWQWTWADTEHCILRDFKAVVDLMEAREDVTFSISQIPSYDTVRLKAPALFRKVKEHLASGRWENLASTWVEGDLSMADGESLARHFLYAQDWSVKHLGQPSRVFFGPDTFGHPGNMPQLARLGGCDLYFHWRCNPGGEGENSWPVRRWHGVDGTGILALSSSYGGMLTPGTDMYFALHESLCNMRNGIKDSLNIWGLGDHGGGINHHNLWCLEQYRQKPLIPTFVHDTLGGYSDALTANADLDTLPANTGETFLIFKGCYTSQSRIKRYNRQCEGALLAAEALSALAGHDRTEALRDAWTPILYNQFHDILDGASVPDSYVDAYARAERSLKTSARVQKEALALLAPLSKTGRTLTIVNPLGFERNEMIDLKLPKSVNHLIGNDNTLLPVQHDGKQASVYVANIPAFGSVTLQLPKGKASATPPPPLRIQTDDTYITIENRHYRAKVARNSGIIASYVDRATDRELVACGISRPLSHLDVTRKDMALNVFQVIDESPNGMSAWHIHDIRGEQNLIDGATVEILEQGALQIRLRITHRFRKSRIVEDIVFHAHYARIDFEAEIDWHEPGGSDVGIPHLKVSFATQLSQPRLRCEGPFVVDERPADGMDNPTQKWVSLTDRESGFAIYNDSRYGYDALGGRIRLSLLRSSYAPDPQSDQGTHHIKFAFEPHASDMANAELVRRGMAFNRPVFIQRTEKAPTGIAAPFELCDTPGVICTALRRAEHSDSLIVRLFECNGETTEGTMKVDDTVQSVEEVDFLERSLGSTHRPRKNRTVTLAFRPFEVKTLQLKRKV